MHLFAEKSYQSCSPNLPYLHISKPAGKSLWELFWGPSRKFDTFLPTVPFRPAAADGRCPVPFFLSWSLPQIESRVGGHQHACRKQRGNSSIYLDITNPGKILQKKYADTWNSLKRFHFLERFENCVLGRSGSVFSSCHGGSMSWLHLKEGHRMGMETGCIGMVLKFWTSNLATNSPQNILKNFIHHNVRCLMKKAGAQFSQISLKSDAHGFFRWHQLRIAIPLTY